MLRQSILAGVALFFTSALCAQEAKLTDPQIAHVAYTAGQIDVGAAKLALSKTSNPDVRAFAEVMARDHAAVNDKALALVQKLKVKPEDNPVSQSLTKQAAETEARLKTLSGAAFDHAYIENEVTYHRAVNGALSAELIPGARNAELKALLESGLTLFKEHQAHAEKLAETVK